MTKYLKAGQLIQPKRQIVELSIEEFNIVKLSWEVPVIAKFVMDTEEFAREGFCKVFKAKCFDGNFGKGNFVIKVPIEDPENLGHNEEHDVQSRKCVQMHMVTRNLAICLARETPVDYGDCFEYKNIFYATMNGKVHRRKLAEID